MTSSSSGRERELARIRVLANRRRHRRSRSDGSRSSSSTSTSGYHRKTHHNVRDSRALIWRTQSRKGFSNPDRHRRRKRSPNPRPRRRARSTSSSSDSYYRLRFHKCPYHDRCQRTSWTQSKGSKYCSSSCCSCGRVERERENYRKRKDRGARSPSFAHKHRRSRSRESFSTGSRTDDPQNLKQKARKQDAAQDGKDHHHHYSQPFDELRISSGRSLSDLCDSEGRGDIEIANELPQAAEDLKTSRANLIDFKQPPLVQQCRCQEKPSSCTGDSIKVNQQEGRFQGMWPWVSKEGVSKSICEEGQPFSSSLPEQEVVAKYGSDWLNLSLKVPELPLPRVEGVRRGDLRLSLDGSLGAVSPWGHGFAEESLQEAHNVEGLQKHERDQLFFKENLEAKHFDGATQLTENNQVVARTAFCKPLSFPPSLVDQECNRFALQDSPHEQQSQPFLDKILDLDASNRTSAVDCSTIASSWNLADPYVTDLDIAPELESQEEALSLVKDLNQERYIMELTDLSPDGLVVMKKSLEVLQSSFSTADGLKAESSEVPYSSSCRVDVSNEKSEEVLHASLCIVNFKEQSPKGLHSSSSKKIFPDLLDSPSRQGYVLMEDFPEVLQSSSCKSRGLKDDVPDVLYSSLNKSNALRDDLLQSSDSKVSDVKDNLPAVLHSLPTPDDFKGNLTSEVRHSSSRKVDGLPDSSGVLPSSCSKLAGLKGNIPKELHLSSELLDASQVNVTADALKEKSFQDIHSSSTFLNSLEIRMDPVQESRQVFHASTSSSSKGISLEVKVDTLQESPQVCHSSPSNSLQGNSLHVKVDSSKEKSPQVPSSRVLKADVHGMINCSSETLLNDGAMVLKEKSTDVHGVINLCAENMLKESSRSAINETTCPGIANKPPGYAELPNQSQVIELSDSSTSSAQNSGPTIAKVIPIMPNFWPCNQYGYRSGKPLTFTDLTSIRKGKSGAQATNTEDIAHWGDTKFSTLQRDPGQSSVSGDQEVRPANPILTWPVRSSMNTADRITYEKDTNGQVRTIFHLDDSEAEEVVKKLPRSPAGAGQVSSSMMKTSKPTVVEDSRTAAGIAYAYQCIDRGRMGLNYPPKPVEDPRKVPAMVMNRRKTPSRKFIVSGSALIEPQPVIALHSLLPNREKWKPGIFCDLCNLGPSLSFGEWYCWVCGSRADRCDCGPADHWKKKNSVGCQRPQKKIKPANKPVISREWSGRVHRMCALWSSEVYEVDKDGNRLGDLDAAVKRGNSLLCADCRKPGATLGCRVKRCKRSYHYPCADKLASKFHLRMWDGVTLPIACSYHRHIDCEVPSAKDRPPTASIKCLPVKSKGDPSRTTKANMNVPVGRTYGAKQRFIGRNLLCEDISGGQEAVPIPCTNDVDDQPVPSFQYITKCRVKGQAVDVLHPEGTLLAKGCEGCTKINDDDPFMPMSVHVLLDDRVRDNDDRPDWQGECLYGRLPYNQHGVLVLGGDTKDVVECNQRCKCGPGCINRELQKGLHISLELFKTKDRGWGVRALEPISRGRFVVEYVGECLTQHEADEKGVKYDEQNLSYLFSLDHPKVDHRACIVLDGYNMSNIARFINHSCEGNINILRVYSETTELPYFRIGMYANRDIEIGEELAYDYNYTNAKDSEDEDAEDPTAIRCCCGASSCREWLWSGGS